jgi:6-phosphofructokinase 1
MNAALRAVVRTSLSKNIPIMGVMGGYQGLIHNQISELESRQMGNIIQRGGTILKTARCPEFMKPEGRALAAQNLKDAGVEGLVVIGGDGSFQGAHLLWQEHQIPVIGIPGTIDNDIYGTDSTIGFDTAVNTALDAIDRIRDTATSHDRVFIVEVMGRNSGFLAAAVGLAGGAEEIFVPEFPFQLDKVLLKIKGGIDRGKKSSILVAAEGQKPGRAYDLAEQLRKKSNIEAKVCILGHQQRGGAPSAGDRNLATRLGVGAVELLCAGKTDLMVGLQGERIVSVELKESIEQKKTLSREFLQLANLLSN